jgi:ubiquinone/menaquinone biosynthesis C-methylase UbiE
MTGERPGLKTSVAGRGVYPASRARWLLHPFRRLIMSPRRICARLALKPSDRVLEIGPGPGWFSPQIARAIPDGRLVLFDIQREMLAMADQRLKAAGVANYQLVEGDAESLPFEPASFDAVLLVTVLGEIGDPGRALREIRRVLQPGGRIVVTEQLGDPDHVQRNSLEAMVAASGLRVVRVEGSLLLYTATLAAA